VTAFRRGAGQWPLRADVQPVNAPAADPNHVDTAQPGDPEPTDRTMNPAGRGLNNTQGRMMLGG
jgi:hypothetical protein